MLARRDSFLARSKVAGDQQLKNVLQTSGMTHTSLFAGQVTSVAKELAECKRQASVVFNKRAAASSTPVGRHDLPQSSWARAQPARSCNSQQSRRSCGWPPFPFFGLLEVPNKGPVGLASSPTGTSCQFRVSAAIDHQPGALSSARGQQQERAPKGPDTFPVGKGGHQESGEEVLTRVLQPVVCNP